MLWYSGASVGARVKETADGPAGSGVVRDRRVRELHVADADFKGTSVRVASGRRGSGQCAAWTPRRRGTGARGVARTMSQREARLARNCFIVPLFERENLQKFE
jgi:hypothetical protein